MKANGTVMLDELVDFALLPGTVPTPILTQARLALLDALGCAIAGRRMPASSALARWAATRPGGTTVLALGCTSERETAAFVNAQFINAMDFDPVSSAGHDVPAIVAAALVAVEGAGGSGSDLLESIAVGLEVSTRLALRNRELAVVHPDHVRYVGNPLFAPAVVAAIARAVELSAAECRDAMSLAVWLRPTDTVADYFTATTVSMAKYAMFGQLAQIGLTAAELARSGFTGPAEAFAPDSELWRIGASRQWPPLPVTEASWRHLVRHKLLPTNLPTIAIKAAFGELVAARDLGPDDMERVVLEVGDTGDHAVMSANELRTAEDAILHVPYQLACLALRLPRVSWMLQDTLRRSDVRRFMDRVEVRRSGGPARLEIVTPHGVLRTTATAGAGTLTAPSSAGDVDLLLAKFVECAAPAYGTDVASVLAERVLAVDTRSVLQTPRLAPPPPDGTGSP